MSAVPILDIRSFRQKAEDNWRKGRRVHEIREFTEACRRRAATHIFELLTDREVTELWRVAPGLMKLEVKWRSK